MQLRLKRIAKRNTYTIGKLYIDGEYFCDTIEDKDRGLKQNTPLEQIKKVKVQHQTAIPVGEYEVTLNAVSPRFSKRSFYRTTCNGGRVPRLLNVPGFEGILIHVGNTASDSSGCILVGNNSQVGKVLNSTATFKKLYAILDKANRAGDKIKIKVE